MLVWLTLPFYDFCGFRSVAVNSVYKLQFFTFISEYNSCGALMYGLSWHMTHSVQCVEEEVRHIICGDPTPAADCPKNVKRACSPVAAPRTWNSLPSDIRSCRTVDTSRPTCSDSLNLMPPTPLYLRTLRRYTNPAFLFIYLFYYYLFHVLGSLMPLCGYYI